jgi:hypothetical protein
MGYHNSWNCLWQSGNPVGVGLKSREVKIKIVKTFEGYSRIDSNIFVDSKLLANGSEDRTVRVCDSGTGKLVASPFKSER